MLIGWKLRQGCNHMGCEGNVAMATTLLDIKAEQEVTSVPHPIAIFQLIT